MSLSPRPDASARPARKGERGFTLIETVVAILILTVGLVAVAQLMAVSVRMHQIGRDSATAARLAQDKFEELMKMNFTLNPAIQVGGNLAANTGAYFDVPANSGYTRRWSVANGPTGNTRVVTVRVVPDVPVGDPFQVTTVLRSW
jgi:prepilin-type N-terminal cleavage/methylation domain-containing protein